MKGKQRSFIQSSICKEPTCKQEFINNNRNSHNTKEFCSSSCSSKYSNRLYRLNKESIQI